MASRLTERDLDALARLRLGGRLCADRPRSRVLLFASLGSVLVLTLSTCGQTSDTHTPPPPSASSTYTLMQMNLCLSHLAGCYRRVAYPAVVEEAVARISEVQPDAVTFNEACAGDVALIARRTGYHLRFARVIYRGKALACMQPGGRGLFGNAVLTKAAIKRADSRAFEAQGGIERRRWLCVTTRSGVDVCTAHLATRQADEAAANDPQCTELRALLARRAVGRAVIFGGDVNRRSSCAPKGFWTRTDSSAEQDPGRQHAYGTGAKSSPSVEVLPARHTDHDILVVRARLSAGP